MKKAYLKLLTAMTAFFVGNASMEGVEIKEGESLNLSAEQQQEIDKHFGQEGLADKFMNYHNEQAAAKDNDAAKKLAQQFLAESKDEDDDYDASEEEEEEMEEEATATDAVQKLGAKVKTLEANLATANDTIQKLADAPDVTPVETVTGKPKASMKNSATHFRGTNLSFDAFQNRAWNQNAKAVMSGTPIDQIEMTRWGDKVVYTQLEEDLGEYSRTHSNEIVSFLMDEMTLPAHWERVSGVSDEYVSLGLVTGNITQAWKDQFLPNNVQRFEPVINKIFDIQIDALFTPKELKAIEKNYLRTYFVEGSDPYKPRFVTYMFMEILKKARQNDKIALFKGVHDDDTSRSTAGHYLNSMDGYFKLINDNRGVNFTPLDLPAFTKENTYDVINDIFDNKLPYDFKMNSSLICEVGPDVHKWYHKGREAALGANTDYEPITGIEGRTNVQLVSVPQFEHSGLITIFIEGTVGYMVDVPGEESAVTFEREKRNVVGLVDYKLGPFIKAFGASVDPDNPTLDNQMFFTNTVELLKDVYLPGDSNDATPSVEKHHALKLGAANTQATDVTRIDDITAGQYVYLYGDSDANISTIKNGANLILDGGDFALAKGNRMTLLGLAGGKAIEVNRYTAGASAPVTAFVLPADATTANAENGNRFETQANSAATELTDIENAVKNEEYTLIGGSDTNPTSITASGNAKFLLTADVSLTEGTSITLLFNGSKFIETARS